MPQVDIESLVCGGGDPKVACETTLPDPDAYPYPDPDVPAESFRIKITDEIEWLDINVVYERDDSTKGTTNPKSHHQNQLQQQHQHSSKRFSGNLKAIAKAPIIGLPNKVQHSGYLGQSTRRPGPHGGRIFPKKGAKVSDPGSPKVSCFGKVLSERERSLRRAAEAVEVEAEEGGCFGCFGRRRKTKTAAPAAESRGSARDIPSSERRASAEEAETPGLGAMKRFVSGRRPASWGGDVDTDLDVGEGHVAWSGPLDQR